MVTKKGRKNTLKNEGGSDSRRSCLRLDAALVSEGETKLVLTWKWQLDSTAAAGTHCSAEAKAGGWGPAGGAGVWRFSFLQHRGFPRVHLLEKPKACCWQHRSLPSVPKTVQKSV